MTKADVDQKGEPKPSAHDMTPIEMINELIDSGYITPVSHESQWIMPSAYRAVPTISKSDSQPPVSR